MSIPHASSRNASMMAIVPMIMRAKMMMNGMAHPRKTSSIIA